MTVAQWEALAEKARYNANELAKLCTLSTRQLQRNFHRRLGRSPQNWLDERRIVAAQQRLLSGQQVKRVAFELGFKQTSHFCRQFKSFNHLTPSEFVLFSVVDDRQMTFADNRCRPQITRVN